jgi:hypothetical protein
MPLLQAAAFKDRWQRTQAEMANLIARQNREKETLQTYAVQVSGAGGLQQLAARTQSCLHPNE